MTDDQAFMREALAVATAHGADPALSPIGRINARDGNILAARQNRVAEHHDATAHAMRPTVLLAVGPGDERQAGKFMGGAMPGAVIRIGTAGWNVPAELKVVFPDGLSHLQRYASRMNGVEINTSFSRPHQKKTYERWAQTTPDDFRFAVKLPRAISHAAQLQFKPEDVARFAAEVSGLGAKFGVLLVQFPPRLAFDAAAAARLFEALRKPFEQTIVCEPRHKSWFSVDVDRWMAQRRIVRVAADPEPVDSAGEPGGWRGVSYFRLHGTPRIYYSKYNRDALTSMAGKLERLAATAPVWCMFDNTAAGAALGDARFLQESLRPAD